MALKFTKTEKGLLERAARILDANGKELLKAHGPVWSATKAGVNAKLVFDRLQRDQRDLRAVAKRLFVQAQKDEVPAPPTGASAPAPAVLVSDGSPEAPWPFPPGSTVVSS